MIIKTVMSRKHPGFKPKEPHQHKDLTFPEGFLWGTATSSHQVEGWNEYNDWWEWEHLPGTIADGQMSGRAADHYHKFREDFDIVQKLGNNAHRLSIEWSRINPRKGEFNQKAIDHYIEVLKDLKHRNIKVMLTLHHFTLPIWFADMGGFAKKENVQWFSKFVKEVVPQLREYVDFWITINEPNIYAMMSYMLGLWPPGITNNFKAYKVFSNLALAHREAYEIIHDICSDDNPQVGVAHNVISFETYNKHSFSDWLSVKIVDWVWNHWFIEKTKVYHDFLGLNYYVHKRVKNIGLRNWSDIALEDRGEGRERSDLDWEIFAPGLFDVLVDMNDYGLPIYVTENGISTLNDDQRARYLVSYLKELYHAIQAGVKVKGYFYWSLLDNFEWDKGLTSRFGLVEVDFKTLDRKIRGSGYLYKRICEENGIDHDLLRFIGHSVSSEEMMGKLNY